MIHWQNIVVALILVATGVYLARRAWSRVRSLLRPGKNNPSSCAVGCNGCGH
jgi:hypothetical protein